MKDKWYDINFNECNCISLNLVNNELRSDNYINLYSVFIGDYWFENYLLSGLLGYNIEEL